MAGLGAAGVFELITLILRFGFGLQATRDTAALASLLQGYRVHHMYLGAAVLILAPCIRDVACRNGIVAIGLGLVVSDLVHHFVVLRMMTGSAEFHFRYPRSGK